jgi:hypothetical protein
MDKKLEFGIKLLIASLLIFIVTYNFFGIIIFVIKFIAYLSVIITFIAGIYELWEYLTSPKK